MKYHHFILSMLAGYTFVACNNEPNQRPRTPQYTPKNDATPDSEDATTDQESEKPNTDTKKNDDLVKLPEVPDTDPLSNPNRRRDDPIENELENPATPEDPITPACPAEFNVAPPMFNESANNKIEETRVNRHNDVYLYNKDETLKIGVRSDWGASVIFYGQTNGRAGQNQTNVIDGADTGREVQVALYDHDRWYQGCAWNESCRTQNTSCPETMEYLGWNPVQGGNRCNIGSGIESGYISGGQIITDTIPLYWNPNWERQDCSNDVCKDNSRNKLKTEIQIKQSLRFVHSQIVELAYQVKNLGDKNHASAPHEFPTLYASFGKDGSQDLYRLMTGQNQEIVDGWNTDTHGFQHNNYNAPKGWSALVNQSANYGVGLYYESGMDQFQAWRKLDNPTKFNNFRGRFHFAIPAYGTIEARAYLMIGSLQDIATQAQWLKENLAPFGSLDTPSKNDRVDTEFSVTGWAMDNISVNKVEAVINGVHHYPLNYGSNRPDVCKVWVGYPACQHNNVGFNGNITLPSLEENTCGHMIEIIATDNDGNESVISRRKLNINP